MSKDKEGSTYNYKKARGSGPNNPNWKGGRRVKDTGYVYVRSDGREEGEHRLIYRHYMAILLDDPDYQLPKGIDIHHINHVKTDNRLINLEAIPHDKHIGMEASGRKHSEETKAKIREACKQAYHKRFCASMGRNY